ncbi:GmrSD restriction endonuclease domain-containing protein [Achromobacter aegrifaciens]
MVGINTITIRQLLQRISDGEVRVPAFQRDFVWEPDRVQFLMDSIYKGYPIGTVLFWRTKEQLLHDRDVGPFSLPDPKMQYPIDYVLDGQQRLTSIFSTFQTELKKNPESKVKWVDIYFDLQAKPDAQDSQFVALEEAEVQDHHVPLRYMFDVSEWAAYTRKISDPATLKILDSLQALFKEAQIPVETVETEEHSKIAIIFERINRGGVPLDTYQLLSAWTWSGDFDLRKRFEELAVELDEVGYFDLHDDPDLLLKCCAAVVRNDASAHAIVDLKGAEVRDAFATFRTGLLGAIEFLRRDIGAASLKVLPYKSMIIPLVRCFATDKAAGFHPNAAQRKALCKWFWHSCFSRRYSNSVDNAIAQDIAAVQQLLAGNISEFDKRSIVVQPTFFTTNQFALTSVNTKVFILLLAQAKPKSFLSAADVDLDEVLQTCNRTEFHHVFPKNYLALNGFPNKAEQFILANFAFLSQKDNRSIQDKAPSDYAKMIPPGMKAAILGTSLIPPAGLEVPYRDFIDGRAQLLADAANRLVA